MFYFYSRHILFVIIDTRDISGNWTCWSSSPTGLYMYRHNGRRYGTAQFVNWHSSIVIILPHDLSITFLNVNETKCIICFHRAKSPLSNLYYKYILRFMTRRSRNCTYSDILNFYHCNFSSTDSPYTCTLYYFLSTLTWTFLANLNQST